MNDSTLRFQYQSPGWEHELQTGSCLILYGVIGDVDVSTEEQQGLIVHNIYIYLLCAGVGDNGELLRTT